MDVPDWRAQLPPHIRQMKVNEIKNKLRWCQSHGDDDELLEVQKTAQSFEKKTYAGSASEEDYLGKISSMMQLISETQTGQVYQKIKIMKETYLPELNEMHQKIAVKLQQHDSLPQQPKSEQLNKLKMFKSMLERLIAFLQVPKNKILPRYKEKLGSYEKQIVNFISANRHRKNLQPGQLAPPAMHSMSQPQSQLAQVQSHENQINSQLEPTNIQGSVTAQQGMMNPMQPGASLDSGQGNHLNTLLQVPASTLQQNTASAPQQTNMNPISSQGGANVIQSDVPVCFSTHN